MKGQNTNRILPIKSLLENLKQETKKQYLQLEHKPSQLDNKTVAPNFSQNNATPRIAHQSNLPNTQKPHLLLESGPTQHGKDQQKGISLNKHSDKNSNTSIFKEGGMGIDLHYPSFYSAKKQKPTFEISSRFCASNQESFKIDAISDHYHPITNKSNKSEQIFYHHYKPQGGEGVKNPEIRQSDQFQKQSITLTQKFNSKAEEETRYVSRFQKSEIQPIFKDELTKIKTQLFQKQAILFHKTQELEEKEKIIKILQSKVDTNRNFLPQKTSELIETNQALRKNAKEAQRKLAQQKDKIIKLQEKISIQSLEIQELRTQLTYKTQIHIKQQEDHATYYALMNLKLRQYEAEEKQQQHQLQGYKQKQRKAHQHQDKIIKGLNELLRQKEDIIVRQQLLLKPDLSKQKEFTLTKIIENKQSFIRELSAEVGDLKISLKDMEMRLREMIEQEEQLRRLVEEKSEDLKSLNTKVIEQLHQIQHLKNQNKLLLQKNERIELDIAQKAKMITIIEEGRLLLEKQLIDLQAKMNETMLIHQVKQSTLEATVKTQKSKISELNEIVFKREHCLVSYKQKNQQLQEKLRKANSPSRITPPKINVGKLMKDNERLSQMAKDMDGRLYQSFKLNQSLNEEIVKRDLAIINRTFSCQVVQDTE